MHPYFVALAGCLLLASSACAASPAQEFRSRTQTVHPEAPTQGATPLRLGERVEGAVQITAIVRRIFEDSRGHLWIGSNDEGIFRYDGESLIRFSEADGLAGWQITGILEDSKGRIWISTNGGVSRFDGQAFVSYTAQDGLSADRVWSLFQDRDGTLWAGTAGGLCRFDGERFAPIDLPASVGLEAPGIVWCTAQDRHGALWFGTDRGVRILENGELRALSEPGGPGNDRVPSIAFDGEERVWITSMGSGLFRYDGRSFLHWRAPDDIGGDEVWFTTQDRAGRVWFSSEGFGVYRWDGASLCNYAAAEGLAVLAVQCVLEDRAGRIWAGGGNGLYRLEGERFVHVKRDGPW